MQSLRLARAPAAEDAEMPAGVLEAPSWDVFEREVPEWLLVTEQRNVAPHQLPTFIADAIGRLSQLSPRTPGTPQTPVLTIYHARVNGDGDGPVEVCIALDPADVSSVIDQGLPHGVSMRREAGHRELCVTLTKRQVVYPDILAAYELIETQARSDNGETIARRGSSTSPICTLSGQTTRSATSPSRSNRPRPSTECHRRGGATSSRSGDALEDVGNRSACETKQPRDIWAQKAPLR